MFETVFKYPVWRVNFVNQCASQGSAQATLLRHARELLVIAERINIAFGDTVGQQTIETAAERWARGQHDDRHRGAGPPRVAKTPCASGQRLPAFPGCLEPQLKINPFGGYLRTLPLTSADDVEVELNGSPPGRLDR